MRGFSHYTTTAIIERQKIQLKDYNSLKKIKVCTKTNTAE